MAAMPDTRWFTIDEARTLLPDVQALAAEIIEVRADLAEASLLPDPPLPVPIADRKAMEARLADLLDRLAGLGLQVKGWAPLLVDFPMRHGDRVVLLCWLEGEPALTWYHDADCGFAGRRPLDRLH
jgi:hypothetical protein